MSSQSNLRAPLVTSALLLAVLSTIAPAKTIYVDDDAAGANDGTSWENAHVYLQDALGATAGGDEIRVAQGIYRPDLGGGNTPGDRRATFRLVNNVIIKGGFAGVGEPDADVRNVETYETILSGDLNGDDVTVANAQDLQDEPTRAENSYNVITGRSISEAAVLDSLVVTGGNNYSPIPSGGGMDNSGNSSPTLINCTFRANSSRYGGGGMVNSRNSNPTLTDCTFSGNSAARGAGAIRNSESSPILTNCTFSGNWGRYGGGMYNDNSNLTLTNCRFSRNWAENNGGGMYNTEDNATLTNCTFNANWAENGGGIYNMNSSPTVTDCTFVDNSAAIDGGGIYNDNSDPTLAKCTFTENAAAKGGGMGNDKGSPTLTNCDFSGNSADSGGGMSNTRSSAILVNCSFRGNFAEQRGGGLSNFENIPIYSGGGTSSSNNQHPILTNCTFSANSAADGAGIYNFDSNTSLSNCTFVQNSAENGNALYCRSQWDTTSDVELIDCILWNGGNEIWNDASSTIVITYSNVQGGFPGAGNIDADPLFADAGYWADGGDPNAVWVDGDYHLKSETGRWDPANETWVKDDVTSPCIDAGDPDSDWEREVWPHGGRVNMGAYGGTREASLSAEPQAMSLPRIAYVHYYEVEVARGYQALFTAYGCTTALIPWDEVATTTFDTYDLIIAGTDTGYYNVWADEQNVAAVEGSGKPVVGLGRGGYWYFGYLDLTIGKPNGGHDFGGAIEPVDPSHPLFSEPYPIEIPQDGVLELCVETDQINIYLYPAAPDTVTTIGQDAGNRGYYTIALEQDRYLFWGFEASAESLTEAGRKLFVNAVIRAANTAW